jgi:hypothetical protein
VEELLEKEEVALIANRAHTCILVTRVWILHQVFFDLVILLGQFPDLV